MAMASIILSFVGNQDPFSDNTEQEGSIVSLVNHLLAEQHTISRVILLHTATTEQRASDTKTWLTATPANLLASSIAILPVDESLSEDPVNLLLAVQAARQGIELALPYLGLQDTLEFNASSGTPVMKSAWSTLQAAGYAPQSHVWQVRNPKEMRAGQPRVFKTDVNTLKNEFDLKVIQRQIQDYNYSGALITLNASQLATEVITALLQYGYYRISFDFDQAHSCLGAVADRVDCRWLQEIALLRQKDTKALLQEVYFNALIRLKGQKYSDFLISVFRLQEQVLYFLVQDKLGLQVSGKRSQQMQSWQAIKQIDQGNLYQHLQKYTLPRGDRLNVDQSVNRYTLLAILEYYPQFASLIPLIQGLNQYCDLRNDSVHGFVGVSYLEDEATVLTTLSKLMKQVTGVSKSNPLDLLNEHICNLLDLTFQPY